MSSRLLVIEDESQIADFLLRGLGEEGFSVQHASDGRIAWQLRVRSELTGRRTDMTLVNRVSAFFLVALAVSLLVSSCAIFFSIRYYLFSEFDSQVLTGMRVVGAAIEVEEDGVKWQPSEHTIGVGDDLEIDDVRWIIVDGNGREIDHSANMNHSQEAIDAIQRLPKSTQPPEDLLDLMALAAIGGPATTALRSLVRTCDGEQLSTNMIVRDAAGAIGWALRYQFNLPEVIAMIRGMNRAEPYWRRVLEYCCQDCLQSALDEYMHVMTDAQSLTGKSADVSVKTLAASLTEAVTIRVAQPHFDDIQAREDGSISLQSHVTRSRFAMRFGDDHAEQESSRLRKEHVRAAFNSPFWPFVLATTSIGQEGLDFHPYCHAVVHWNLSGNPVDLEQREGRVHRYKGHAVRKNVASRNLKAIVDSQLHEDPWTYLFDAARKNRSIDHDLIPYWLYSIEGGAMIERHLPLLPLSKEIAMLPGLRRSLAVYRMVFGQPLQDDLLEYLSQRFSPEQLADHFQKLRIDLTPSDHNPVV